MFEQFRPTAEVSKSEKKEKRTDVYGRVAAEAENLLRERLEEDEIGRAIKILYDPEFEVNIKKRWNEYVLQTQGEESDPEEQEKLWAKGLMEKVIDRISQ